MFKVGEVDFVVAGVNVGSGERRKDFRIIEKLEDLEGMENGWGLYLSIKPYIENGEHTEVLAVMSRGAEVCVTSFDLYNNNNIERDIVVMRSMGFEIRYKPLRTKEEVLEDLVEKDFKYGEGNFILIQHEHGTWDYMNNISFKTPGQKYYTIESVKKVTDELNEILKNNK